MTVRPLLVSLVSGLVLSQAVPSHAGRIDEGTIEIGLSGLVDFEGAGGTTTDVDLLGGYFILDGVLVGGRFGLFHDDFQTRFSGKASLEQHFETLTPWLPYVGISLGVVRSELEYRFDGESLSDTTTALVIGLNGGVKFYLTDAIALDLNLGLSLASDDVYLSDGKPDNTDLALRVGLRTFLF